MSDLPNLIHSSYIKFALAAYKNDYHLENVIYQTSK
jgi:hypothetical protein